MMEVIMYCRAEHHYGYGPQMGSDTASRLVTKVLEH